MENFEFTIIATGLDPEADDFADRFFEAGCDDATLAFQKGVIIVGFDRERGSFEDAVGSAIADVRKAGATVLRVEPDHLVNLSDVADRSRLSRQAIANYASGRRGKGFPAPAMCLTTDHPLYDWREVARWLAAQGTIGDEAVERAVAVKKLNDDLEQEHEAAARQLETV